MTFHKLRSILQWLLYLGLSGYYRKHIKNFSELALPLTDLTKKGKATIVEWSEACEKSFNDLKSALSAEPVLKSPDFDKHFYLLLFLLLGNLSLCPPTSD
jgi:hypothetical protein